MDFEPFLKYLANHRACSLQTIRAYRSDLKMFHKFAKDKGIGRINQVDHLVITAYTSHMQQELNLRSAQTGLSDATIARRLAALSSYFDFLYATEDPKLRNPLKGRRTRWKKNDKPKPIDDATVDRLLAHIASSNLRDRALFTLFLSTGLRVSEMYQLNRASITIQTEMKANGEELILGCGEVIGKGNKRRTFYVDSDTLTDFALYVASRTDNEEALFLSERKQRMSVRAIQYTLQMLCVKAGLPNINVHRFRHTYATRLANANMSTIILKDLMGHKSFNTTLKYFKLNDTTMARGYHAAMEFRRGNY